MSYIEKIYNKILIVTPGSDVFSMQTLILSFYVVALFLAIYRAQKSREKLTDFITIIAVCVKYGATAILVETFLDFIRLENHTAEYAQMLYLYLFFINIFSIFFLFYLHVKLSYVFGLLYQAVSRIFLYHGFLHLAIWFKLYIFNMQTEFEEINYIYSFLTLYFSATLAVAMLKPKLLGNLYIRNIVSPSLEIIERLSMRKKDIHT